MIRPARLADVPEIAAIHVEAQAGSSGSTYDKRVELWNHVLGGGSRRTRVWVALDAATGAVIGFASAGAARVLKGRFDGELTTIYVSPGSQRVGVGTALVRLIFAWFVEQKFQSAMTWAPESGGAIAFFTGLGAEELTDRRETEVALGWSRLLPPV